MSRGREAREAAILQESRAMDQSHKRPEEACGLVRIPRKKTGGPGTPIAPHLFSRPWLRHGVLAVVIARIIPFINPDVVSYAAGLTGMRWRLFMPSIAVGSLPSTILYSYLGSRGITIVGWLLMPLEGLGVVAFLGAALYRMKGGALAVAAATPPEESH
jgi:hypothetical protein